MRRGKDFASPATAKSRRAHSRHKGRSLRSGKFKDEYELALRKLVKHKAGGKPIEASKEEEDRSNIVDLMEAVRQSVKDGGRRAVCLARPGRPEENRQSAFARETANEQSCLEKSRFSGHRRGERFLQQLQSGSHRRAADFMLDALSEFAPLGFCARTGLFIPQLGRLALAVPASTCEAAGVWLYQTSP